VRTVYLFDYVEVPDGVDVEVEKTGPYDYRVIVKGPLGSVIKEFKNTPVKLSLEDKRVVLEVYNAKKREYSLVGTYKGILKNAILGVTRGWRYKMKIIYTHFPMLVKIQENTLIVENFLGRKSKIYIRIPQGVRVQVVGKEDLVIEGVDRDLLGNFAATIEESVRLKGDEKPSPHGREGGLGVVDGIYLAGIEHIK